MSVSQRERAVLLSTTQCSWLGQDVLPPLSEPRDIIITVRRLVSGPHTEIHLSVAPTGKSEFAGDNPVIFSDHIYSILICILSSAAQ